MVIGPSRDWDINLAGSQEPGLDRDRVCHKDELYFKFMTGLSEKRNPHHKNKKL
jgi:hypothetical protein